MNLKCVFVIINTCEYASAQARELYTEQEVLTPSVYRDIRQAKRRLRYCSGT